MANLNEQMLTRQEEIEQAEEQAGAQETEAQAMEGEGTQSPEEEITYDPYEDESMQSGEAGGYDPYEDDDEQTSPDGEVSGTMYQGKNTKRRRGLMAAQEEIAERGAQGANVITAFQQGMVEDEEMGKSRRQQKADQMNQQSTAELLYDMAGEDDETTAELLQAVAPKVMQTLAKQQEEYMDPHTGEEKAVVDTSGLTSAPRVNLKAYQEYVEKETGKPVYLPDDPEARDRMALELGWANQIAKIADNRSTGEKVVDLGEELVIGSVVPLETDQKVDFVSAVKNTGEDTYVNQVFTKSDNMGELHKWFWSLNEEDQVNAYNTLKDAAESVAPDNPDVQKALLFGVIQYKGKDYEDMMTLVDWSVVGGWAKAGANISVKALRKIAGKAPLEVAKAAKRIEAKGGMKSAEKRIRDISDQLTPTEKVLRTKEAQARAAKEGAEDLARGLGEEAQVSAQLGKLARELPTEARSKLQKELTDLTQDYATVAKYNAGTKITDSLGYAGGKMVRRLVSGVRNSRGNDEIAAQMVHAAASSDALAKEVGTSRVDAAMSVIPMTRLNSMLSGAAPEVAGQVHKRLAKADELFKEGLNTAEVSSTIKQSEKVAFAQKKIKEIERRPDVIDFKFDETTDLGNHDFSVVVTRKSKEEGADPITETIRVPYTENAVTGGFITDISKWDTSKQLVNWMTSARVKLGKEASKDYVDAFGQVMPKGAKLGASWTKRLREIYSGISKRGVERVNSVIELGSKEQREYSYNDLVRGGRPDLPQLNDKEFVAYVEYRKLAQEAWAVENYTQRELLKKRGAKHIKVGDFSAFAEEISPREAIRLIDDTKGAPFDSIWVPDQNAPLSMSTYYGERITLDAALQTGRLEMRRVVGDAIQDPRDPEIFYTHVLVNPIEVVHDLPQAVLKKIEGWSPLKYKNAHFFVKSEAKDVIVNGKRTTRLETLRAFDNIKDAEQYADMLNKENRLGSHAKAKVFRDRERTPVDEEADRISMLGGFSQNSRKQERLKMGLAGEDAQFVSPSQALAEYLETASNRFATSQNKTELIKRWMNEANSHLPPEYRAGTQTFYGMRGIVKAQVTDSATRTKLLEAHDQISTMTRHYSPAESALANVWTNAIEGTLMQSESSLVRKLGSTMYSWKDANPIGHIRSAVTHVLLGMFNPAQLFVQGSAFTTVASIVPQHAPKSLARALKTGAMDMAFDTEEAMLKSGKFSKTDKEFFSAWKRSGLRDTVLTHNDDFHALRNGVPTDPSMIRRIASKHMMFFEMGELFNTRFAFATAYEEWRAANKGVELGDAGLRNIMARADELKLSMMENNRAAFQRNQLTAIPTQFWQVTTKTLEAMMGQSLTAGEKARLLGGQLMFWGTAGTGIDWVANQIASAMGVEPENYPEGLSLARRGLVQSLTHMGGAEVEVGTRANPFSAPKDLIDQLTDPTRPAYEALFGPSWSVGQRVGKLGSSFKYAASGVIHADEIDADTLSLGLSLIAKATADFPTTTRNAIRGYVMYNSQALKNSNGEDVLAMDVNMQTAVAKALGFQTTVAKDYYESRPKMSIEASEEGDIVRAMVSVMNSLGANDFSEYNYQDKVAALEFAKGALISSIKDPEQRRRIVNKVQDRLSKRADPESEYFGKRLDHALIYGDALIDQKDLYSESAVRAAKERRQTAEENPMDFDQLQR